MLSHSHPIRSLRLGFILGIGPAVFFPWSSARAAMPSIGSFTPDTLLEPYSVYTTDTTRLPDNSGLATGGRFGSGGAVKFGANMRLRAPVITAGSDFALGDNPNGIPGLNIGRNLSVGNNARFDSSVQVLGQFVSGSNSLSLLGNTWIKGAFALTGNQVDATSRLQLGATFNAPNMSFGPAATVVMSAATGGPTAAQLPAVRLSHSTPFPAIPPLGAPLVLDSTRLPGYAAVKSPAPTGATPAVTIVGANLPADRAVSYQARNGLFTNHYWQCDLGPTYCKGDTLLPGEYGVLDLSGNQRALLVTEGVYSFDSIYISGGSSIVAAQPNGGRTVIVSRRGLGSGSSNSFIGPDSARMATGFGGGTNQFLGGSMMLVTAGDMTIPSDLRVWATLSAPVARIQLTNQVDLFGQAFARTLVGANTIDFGTGAYIPFRGLVPALRTPSFSIREGTDPACSDPSGRPCRDTSITISMSWVTPYTVTADYAVVERLPRSAKGDTDFPVVAAGKLSIPIDSTRVRIPVRIFDDRVWEGPETFRIVFANLHAASFEDSLGRPDTSLVSATSVVTILDDETAPFLRVVADSSIREGDSGLSPLTFTATLIDPVTLLPVQLSDAPELPVALRWSTEDATARVDDSDYVAVAGRWDTLAPGSVAASLPVPVRGDLKYERDETLAIHVIGLLNLSATGSTVRDTGTVRNDDGAPVVRIDDAVVSEPAAWGDTARARFVVHLSRPSGLVTTVATSWLDSSARSTTDPVSGIADYRGISTTLSIPAGDTLDTLAIPVFGDTLHEGPEFFRILLGQAVDASLADSEGLGTIVDADSAPALSLDTARVLEPASGTASLVFRVHLSAPSGLPSSFDARTQAGTALGGLDYLDLATTTWSLRAGLRDTTITVTVLADSIAGEGVETLQVVGANLVGLRPGAPSATGSIVDAQGLPAISIDSVGPVTESDTTIHFHVRLDWYGADTVFAHWRTGGGTATPGLRYEPDSGIVAIPPGKRFDSIAVRLKNDHKAQRLPEDFFVFLDSPRHALLRDSVGRAVLLDDGDEPPVSVSDAAPVREGDSARFAVRILQATRDTVVVRWSTRDGSARAPDGDYAATSGSITFLPGDTLAWVAVPTFVDTLWEPSEAFSVQLDSSRYGAIRDSLGSVALLEEGPAPQVEFSSRDTVVVEDRAGTVVAGVRLSRAASIPLSVALQVASSSTALRPDDWSLTNPVHDTLVFPAFSRGATLLLPVVPDTIEETTERATLLLAPLSPLENGAAGSWTLTILDDDHRPVVVIRRPLDSLRTNVPVHQIDWTLDGVPQTVVDTTLREGWNTIVRTATDTFGHVATDTVRVWADFTPPEIQVFKITGANPLHPERDTTWWGDRARTRFGRDTIWYWVRDSALQDDGSWIVRIDTLFARTDFSGDGLFPTQVSSCDDVGNCAVDTGWIDLKQSIPQVEILDPRDNQPIKAGDVSVTWKVTDGGKTWENHDTQNVPNPGPVTVDRCWTDDVGNTGCDTTHPIADPVHVVSGTYLDRDADGRIDAAVLTLDVPWPLDSLPVFDLRLLDTTRTGQRPDPRQPFLLDSLHLVVPIQPPFAFGITGFDTLQWGRIHQTWTDTSGHHTTLLDTFALSDGTAPVIVKAEIHRVENYKDPDTLWITPSEPLQLTGAGPWLEIGSCPGVRTTVCDSADVVWHKVPAESIAIAPDGRYWFLVQPGDTGSVRPGYVVRFLQGVSDTLGNRIDPRHRNWATTVTGAPRPDLIEVVPPSKIPVISTTEQSRPGPGGILIRASHGDKAEGEWWEPGRGYLSESDPAVREICPDIRYCAGPTIYINRPVRMILYIYDLSGTFAISRVVDITQADIDALDGDKIDRLRITLEWNHRSEHGTMVSTGVYVWRIIAQTHDRGATSGIQNSLWKTGVKVPRE